jgi:hypothetical protein
LGLAPVIRIETCFDNREADYYFIYAPGNTWKRPAPPWCARRGDVHFARITAPPLAFGLAVQVVGGKRVALVILDFDPPAPALADAAPLPQKQNAAKQVRLDVEPVKPVHVALGRGGEVQPASCGIPPTIGLLFTRERAKARIASRGQEGRAAAIASSLMQLSTLADFR